MCGIWALLGKQRDDGSHSYSYYKSIQPRGPDKSQLIEFDGIRIGFHRLAIMDLSANGDQPFVFDVPDENRTIYWICNGELYNYVKLSMKYNITTRSDSDCEIIGPLYYNHGIDVLCRELNGEYAFIIFDIDHNTNITKVFVARDRFGIRPLFIAHNDTNVWLSSELKGIPVDVTNAKQFPPRSYQQIDIAQDYNIVYHDIVSYYEIGHTGFNNDGISTIQTQIRNKLIQSVSDRLVSDRPLGCLLSGGLDSSLVASIAASILAETGNQLNTFSIGLDDSTDEYYARKVAEHIGSNHTHIVLTNDDFLKNIRNVVYATETYDVTTVRASTGQYLVSKWIHDNTDIKVLLIGDGSDELAAGYMYFFNAPNARESHAENMRLLNDIHYYDVLRADRGVADNGLEARVPFLDHEFVDYYLSCDPELRNPIMKTDAQPGRMEKWLLRSSFMDATWADGRAYLPDCVLWRRKEAFSDGVSSKAKSWYSIIQEHVSEHYTDADLETAKQTYTMAPRTKEALYFRELFTGMFGNRDVIPYYWLPKWSGDIHEPSARVLSVYDN